MAILRAILFDVDGTLADTERDGHRAAFNAAFRDAGLDWHWDPEFYGELLEIGGGAERLRHYAESRHPGFAARTDFQSRLAALHRSKTAHYVRLVGAGGIALRAGVRRLLDEARDREIRLAIATTSQPDAVSALLSSTLGAAGPGRFEVIAAGDVVPRKKPAADVYRYALERLGLPATDCVAVEDSEIGLAAARGAGLRTLVTTNDYTRGQDFAGASLVVDGLGEPGRPCRVLAGRGGFEFVDVDVIAAIAPPA